MQNLYYKCLIFGLFCLSSCSSDSNLNELLAGTDTIEIIFYRNDSQPNADTLLLKDKGFIKQVIASIEGNSPAYKCGYEGKMIFRKAQVKEVFLDVEFNLQKDCAHIVYLHKEKLRHRKINAYGVEFLHKARKYRDFLVD
jgi:hypothetical protein